MAFEEDISLFFDEGGHAEKVYIGPADAEEEALAIFDESYQAVSGNYVDVASSLPALTLPSAEVARLGIGTDTRVRIPGRPVPYYVREPQPDGGITTLILRR